MPPPRLSQQLRTASRRTNWSSLAMPLPETRLAALFAMAALAFAGHAAAAQADSAHLKAMLAQMDSASASFTSAQADLRQELFTKAVQDTETQIGQIYVLRNGSSTQMGVRMLAPEAKPDSPPAQIIEFKDGKIQLLTTGTGQVDVFTATGKNQATAQTAMTIGFGGSGRDLEKSWNITDLGPESIAGVQTEKLDLVSKDQTIRNNFSHITIWIDPARDVSLKQVSYNASNGTPTGDTRTVFYTNIRLNQPVKTDAFAIKCKGKCTFIQH
jgi:outer membrane lipoprotein-sorting protein